VHTGASPRCGCGEVTYQSPARDEQVMSSAHAPTLTQVTPADSLLHAAMIGCNVYVSEGRCAQTLDALQRAASSVPGASVVWTFRDTAYHRTGFTLAAARAAPLSAAVLALVGAAFARLDLRTHAASHPRLGVVDHVSCHPLEAASTVADAAEVRTPSPHQRTPRRPHPRTGCTSNPNPIWKAPSESRPQGVRKIGS
jgi:hypothetical protein